MSFALIWCLIGCFLLILNLVSKRFYMFLTEMTRKFKKLLLQIEIQSDNLFFHYVGLFLLTMAGYIYRMDQKRSTFQYHTN